jgi:hypothetical protein
MLVGGALIRWRFVIGSIVMWGLYLASYATFAAYIGAPMLEVTAAILQQPLASLAESLSGAGAIADQTSLFLFVLTPILLILVYGFLMQSQRFAQTADLVLRHGRSGRGAPSAQRDRFSAASSYESFLGALFSGQDRAVSGFGMEAIDDCIVHKFYHGGSDALTALIETDERLVIRKFAVGEAASRLKVQADWLRLHRQPELPLVDIIAVSDGHGVFSYDMPLVTPSNDFYDVIHSSTTARNRERLQTLMNSIDALHSLSHSSEADDAVVMRYLDEKASRNAAAILDFALHAVGRSGV